MTTKISIFLSAILAVALTSGLSHAAGTATTTNSTVKSEPMLKDTDEYPVLGNVNENYGIAPSWSSKPTVKSGPMFRDTDEYSALGNFKGHYGVEPAWTPTATTTREINIQH